MEGDYRFSERMVIDPFNANLVYYGTRCAPPREGPRWRRLLTWFACMSQESGAEAILGRGLHVGDGGGCAGCQCQRQQP